MLSGTNQIFIGASNKSTNISGATNINTSGSATTTIGNINTTTNLSGTNYINKIDTLTPTTNLELYPSITTGDITIAKNTRGSIIIADGATAGTNNLIIVGTSTVSNTYIRAKTLSINDQGSGTTKLSGAIELYSPLTIGYTPPALTSLTQIGYSVVVRAVFGRTFNSTFTAFSPYPSQLPLGVYIISTWTYINPATTGSEIRTDLIGSTSAITEGNTTGFVTCADDGFPPSKFCLFNRQSAKAGEYELNLCGTIVISTNRYIAVGVQSAITAFERGAVELQITRIA